MSAARTITHHRRADAHELNLDGLPGPTHNYAGLAPGNLAAQAHKHHVSNPRAAALQGLAKMKRLADLGIPQAVLPPQPRPDIDLLRRLGFRGDDADVLAHAGREAPELLAAATSASSMWAANAATVTPSLDSADGRVHLTPANLVGELHRAIEPAITARMLHRIFPDTALVAHHPPLPATTHLRDEGAANHTRLGCAHGEPGIQLFVYGLRAMQSGDRIPQRHPARQSLEASAAIARLHELPPERVLFTQQHPDAIDAGVFHNDVAAVGDRDLFFYHRDAFLEPDALGEHLRRRFAEVCDGELRTLEVTHEQVPLDEAVHTYLFNSQLVQCPDGTRAMVLPQQCADSSAVRDYVASIVGPDKPIQHVHHVDLLQSMRNGGGPACLRLRLVLTDAELARMHSAVRLTDALHEKLTHWVERHYRDQLAPADLADPLLMAEVHRALDELTTLLEIGSIYPFQTTTSA